MSAVLAFIADNEPLTATLLRFAPNDHAGLRAALRRARVTAGDVTADGDADGRAPPPPASPSPETPRPAATAERPSPASKPGASPASSSGSKRLMVYSDGASRGNPGLSGAGWVICEAGGKVIAQGNMFLGHRTNNEAEYLAAAMGIQAARDMGAQEVVLRADSELLVRQLQGRYQVRNAKLLPLFNQIKMLRQLLKAFYAEHVPRAANAAADAQANQAIDER